MPPSLDGNFKSNLKSTKVVLETKIFSQVVSSKTFTPVVVLQTISQHKLKNPQEFLYIIIIPYPSFGGMSEIRHSLSGSLKVGQGPKMKPKSPFQVFNICLFGHH